MSFHLLRSSGILSIGSSSWVCGVEFLHNLSVGGDLFLFIVFDVTFLQQNRDTTQLPRPSRVRLHVMWRPFWAILGAFLAF